MKITHPLVFFASLVCAVNPPQSEEQAAINARTLINRENMATLITVNQQNDEPFSGYPTGQIEYVADCHDDGSLTLIGMSISSAFKNIDAGSKVGLSMRTGDHGPNDDDIDNKYPGGISDWVLASPRVSMYGQLYKLDQMTEDETKRIEQCFLKKHPESHIWIPGTNVHGSFWTRFVPDGMHYIGGFGDRAYIGDINVDTYKNAKPMQQKFKFVVE